MLNQNEPAKRKNQIYTRDEKLLRYNPTIFKRPKILEDELVYKLKQATRGLTK